MKHNTLPAALCALLAFATAATAQTIPDLGAASGFAIISSQGVTNSGLTIISGNVALSPLPRSPASHRG